MHKAFRRRRNCTQLNCTQLRESCPFHILFPCNDSIPQAPLKEAKEKACS